MAAPFGDERTSSLDAMASYRKCPKKVQNIESG